MVARHADAELVASLEHFVVGCRVNNNSAPLPAGDEYRSEIEQLLQTLGHRLVLRALTHPAVVAAGGALGA